MRLRVWSALAGAMFTALAAGICALLWGASERSLALESREGIERSAMGALTAAATDAFESRDDLRLARFLRQLKSERPEILEAYVVVRPQRGASYVVAHTAPSWIGDSEDKLPLVPREARVLRREWPHPDGRAQFTLRFEPPALPSKAARLPIAVFLALVLGGSAGWLAGISLGSWLRRRATEREEPGRLRREFVSAVTHELRSPLLAVESYANLLRSQMLESRKTGVMPRDVLEWLSQVDTIQGNAKRLERFIDQLLDAAKIEKGEMSLERRAAPLLPLLVETERLFGPHAAQRGVRLDAVSAPGLPLAYLDPERITQVLRNLVVNALKATPAGGRVTLTAAPARESGFVEICVSDTGRGIPPGAVHSIFEPFRQAERRPGAGLGLHIARTLVEMHGGSLRAENGKPGGARFIFTLPAHAA